jgi:hypothetical protein
MPRECGGFWACGMAKMELASADEEYEKTFVAQQGAESSRQ